jgi:hypothetical protein
MQELLMTRQRGLPGVIIAAAIGFVLLARVSSAATISTISILGLSGGNYQQPSGLLMGGALNQLAPAVTPSDASLSNRSPRSSRDNAQTFTIALADYPAGVDVTGFVLTYTQQVEGRLSTFGVQLYPVADPNAATLTAAGAILVANPRSGAGSLTFPQGQGSADGTMTFNFDATVHLDPGSYAFQLLPNWNTSGADVFKWVKPSIGEAYAGGNYYETAANNGSDATFGLVTVPEPSAIVLAVLSIAAIGVCLTRWQDHRHSK